MLIIPLLNHLMLLTLLDILCIHLTLISITVLKIDLPCSWCAAVHCHLLLAPIYRPRIHHSRHLTMTVHCNSALPCSSLQLPRSLPSPCP